ncbi:MAG: cardiolipin synthase [Humisphaera sp.]|nr:cardiolipin synthase [Humisphaera sp.]
MTLAAMTSTTRKACARERHVRNIAADEPKFPAAGVNIAPGSDDDGWIVPPPVRLADGSEVQLYKDGEALHAAYRAIETAQQTICLEIYIFHSDETGRAFAELLSERARKGLAVRVIYDSIGSIDTDRKMFAQMQQAGVRLQECNPWWPWRCRHGWRTFNRDHRKLIVVDNELGVLGGQNLGNEYGSSWVIGNVEGDAWRDTAVGVRGPSVALLVEAFERMWKWLDEGGPVQRAELIHSTASFADDPRGDGLVHGQPAHRRRGAASQLDASPSTLEIPPDSLAVLASVPSPRSRLLPNLQKLLRDARQSLDLTIAYFAPPQALLDDLIRAARNGVRVRLMLPGRSDVHLLLIAARAHYECLMAAGVEIYERQHAVLHAKTLCVDERISIVGSLNLDYRSIQYNFELSALIHSTPFGAQMRDLFENDMRYAIRIRPEQWRHRPIRDRIVQTIVGRARCLL